MTIAILQNTRCGPTSKILQSVIDIDFEQNSRYFSVLLRKKLPKSLHNEVMLWKLTFPYIA